MQERENPFPSGSLASLDEREKKQRLDAMVSVWQRDTEQRIEREGLAAFIPAAGLDEYRYSVWLRFPEWERSAVLGQVIAVPSSRGSAVSRPIVASMWRRDPLLKQMPDWKVHLPDEAMFNIIVRITPGGLGEGTKWAVLMPKELIPRYKPGWPTQREWVAWTGSFDWLAVAIGFIRATLDS